MLGLRSSPSTLVVPCSLRGAVAAEAGMGFAPLRLTAPRPKRAVMPIMYYDVVSGATGSAGGDRGGGDSSGGLGFPPTAAAVYDLGAVSDYAGVFEAGCDPAKVRASLNRGSHRSSTPVSSPPAPRAAGPNAPVEEDDEPEEDDSAVFHAVAGTASLAEGRGFEDDDIGCLFKMDGVRDDVRAENGRGSGSVHDDGEGMRASEAAMYRQQPNPSVMAVGAAGRAEGRAAASVAVEAGQGPMPLYSAAAGGAAVSSSSTLHAGGGGGAGGKMASVYKGTTAQLRTPRVIAPPGRRCVAGGMYRLRLSTSC